MIDIFLKRKCMKGLLVMLLLLAAGVFLGTTISFASEGEAAKPMIFTQQVTVMRVGERADFKTNRTKVKWKSSNPKVLLMSSKGRARALRSGVARITAISDHQRISMYVSVKKGYTIGIDPGHQSAVDLDEEPIGPGSTTTKTKMSAGTRGVSTGKPEYQLNLEIGLALRDELLERGYKVVMTHSTADVIIGNVDRALKMNQKCDAVIRIHADGAASSAHGASALYPSSSNPYVGSISAACERLSRCVLDSYCEQTGITNRGIVVRDDLTGTNWSEVPVTLIEMGFMTNVFDDSFMSSPEGQVKMVEGLANGVDVYFGR
ncbi:MAG: N-acetylmuramoyl-L-alanine amidase [Lachnospiraceae bacterium]|nr:N-acetylmuramoyl-L-alanine amidase [Lachnospiraceae bacterium]